MELEDVYRIPSLVSRDELRFLVDILSGVDKAKAIVTVGTYYGASSAALLLGMQKYGLAGPLFCIDVFRYHNAGAPKVKPFRERTDIPWSDSFIQETKRNLTPFSKGKEVYYAECFSDDFDLATLDGISLVFIDADHTTHSCLLDALKYSQKVIDGGLMLFHDYADCDPVRKAVTLFIQIRPDFHVEKIHDSIAVVKKEVM